MHFSFATRSLRNLCERQSAAECALGVSIAAALRHRLADLESADSLADLVAFGLVELELTSMPEFEIPIGEGWRLKLAPLPSKGRLPKLLKNIRKVKLLSTEAPQ
jgi:hypothetical protein